MFDKKHLIQSFNLFILYKTLNYKSMNIKSIIVITLIVISIKTFSQNKMELNGYVSNMQSFIFQEIDEDWIFHNLVHNRLNYNWYIHNNLLFNVELRNRFITGDYVRLDSTYATMLEKDNGLINLTSNIFSEKSFILNSAIDRFRLDYNYSNVNITLGRQRINWGQTYVWNPNDIFNSYSYFDFDYEEKPGSDAARIQYYTGSSSSIELVAKADSGAVFSYAAMYRFNTAGYDIQTLTGYLNDEDFVVGFGWSGFIKSVGFRGELTQLLAEENNTFIASVGFDYYFKNSSSLQFEGLFTDNPMELNSFSDYYNQQTSVRNLAFTKVSLFGSYSYSVSPLLNVSFAGMYYPKIHGFFVGPSITYSLNDNADFSIFAQSFHGEFNQTTQKFNLAFLRLKYNF